MIVVPSHPAMNGLTNAGLSGWFASVHQFLQSFPTSFIVLATGVRATVNEETEEVVEETLAAIIASPGGTP